MSRLVQRRYIAIVVLVIGMVGVIGLIGVSMARAAFNTADPIPGQVRFVGIDTDVSGNSFTNVSYYQDIAYLHNGDTFSVDIVADEIDPSDGLLGVEGALLYDGTVAHVVSIDPGSMAFTAADDPMYHTRYSDPVPDNDGFFFFSYEDMGDAAESGEGVLVRITMQCDSQQTMTLRLEDGFDPGTQLSIYRETGRYEPNGPYKLPITVQDTGLVFCGSTPTPTIPVSGTVTPTPTPPGPTPTPTPIGGTPTPTPTPTAQPSETPCPTVSPTNCDVVPTPTPTSTGTPTATPVGDPTATPAGSPTPVDSDQDGVSDASDDCPNWPNASQAMPSWPVPAGDTDCDGFPNSVAASNKAPESYVGTDPLKNCAATSTANDEAVDAMPPDFNDDRVINGQDTGKFGGPFGAYNKLITDGPFNGIPGVRFDFNGDGAINGQDTGKFQAYFNKMCG
jgi:hypothetical protein